MLRLLALPLSILARALTAAVFAHFATLALAHILGLDLASVAWVTALVVALMLATSLFSTVTLHRQQRHLSQGTVASLTQWRVFVLVVGGFSETAGVVLYVAGHTSSGAWAIGLGPRDYRDGDPLDRSH